MIQLTSDHQDIREMVADFSDQELAPIAEQIDEEQAYPTETLKKLSELGMLGVTVPEEFGGTGADTLTAVLMVEELARNCGSTAMVVSSHVLDATRALSSLGNSSQQKEWLPKLASGASIGTFAIAESSAESDAGAMKSLASRSGDQWTLNGEKMAVISGQKAGFAAIVARTGEASAATSGLGLFILPDGASAAGVEVNAETGPLGMRGSGLADWTFNDVNLGGDAILGSEDNFHSISRVLEVMRLGAASVALGVGRGAITYALGYAGERRAFGRTIDRFGAVRSMFAEAATALEGARLMVYHTASLIDQGKSVAREASMAKLAASRAAYSATKSAVQILGGNGYSREYPVERMFRDAGSLELFAGNDALHRMLVARALIGESR